MDQALNSFHLESAAGQEGGLGRMVADRQELATKAWLRPMVSSPRLDSLKATIQGKVNTTQDGRFLLSNP
jgi:hypothetical protein